MEVRSMLGIGISNGKNVYIFVGSLLLYCGLREIIVE